MLIIEIERAALVLLPYRALVHLAGPLELAQQH